VGPYTWSLAGGALPPGLVLDPASGVISGTPTAVGTFPFQVGVTDSQGRTATLSLSAVVARALEILTQRLRNAHVDEEYRARIRARGGIPPRTYTITRGSAPEGLELDPATGVLSGVPEEEGVFRFTVRVRDSYPARVAKRFVLTVLA
jgi:hypothetical protein